MAALWPLLGGAAVFVCVSVCGVGAPVSFGCLCHNPLVFLLSLNPCILCAVFGWCVCRCGVGGLVLELVTVAEMDAGAQHVIAALCATTSSRRVCVSLCPRVPALCVCVCVAAELSALCASLGASLAPADLDDALVKLDKDGSGRIEKGEFMGWWTARSGGADLDGDGRVDAVESQLVRRPAARCVCVSVCLCVCVSVSVCLCVQTCGHDMCSFLLYFCVGFRASRLTQPPPFAYVRPG